jgi:hypothetical protein
MCVTPHSAALAHRCTPLARETLTTRPAPTSSDGQPKLHARTHGLLPLRKATTWCPGCYAAGARTPKACLSWSANVATASDGDVLAGRCSPASVHGDWPARCPAFHPPLLRRPFVRRCSGRPSLAKRCRPGNGHETSGSYIYGARESRFMVHMCRGQP